MLNWDCLSTGILVALNTNISTEDHIHIHTVTWYSCRRYETRRIVITTKDLYIALCKDEITRDIIPLSEIVKIEELNTAKDDPPEPASAPLAASRAKSIRPTQPKPNGNTETPEDNTTSMLFSTARHANVIKITTIQGGYNAGRSYSLQAPSSDTCTMVSRPQPLNFSASLSLSPQTHTPSPTPFHSPLHGKHCGGSPPVTRARHAQVTGLLSRYVAQACKKAVVRSASGARASRPGPPCSPDRLRLRLCRPPHADRVPPHRPVRVIDPGQRSESPIQVDRPSRPSESPTGVQDRPSESLHSGQPPRAPSRINRPSHPCEAPVRVTRPSRPSELFVRVK